jgi:hypothetical protein
MILLLSGFFVLADGLAKLFFPTRNGLSPKSAVLPIHRLPFKLAAFFDLRFEKLLPIERHGLPFAKTRPPHPPMKRPRRFGVFKCPASSPIPQGGTIKS